MSNPIVIIKNNTESPISINDLSGVTVDSTSQLELTDIFYFYDIVKSINLKTYVSNGNIIINDGNNDLSIENGLEHITIKSGYSVTTEITNNINISNSPPDSTSTIWYNTDNSIMYTWNINRNKWLSISRETAIFTHRGNAEGVYLQCGNNFSSNIGFLVHRDSTIGSICARASSGSGIKNIHIKDDSDSLFSFNLTDLYYTNENLDINISNNSFIRVFADKNGQLFDLNVSLEISSRYSI